MKKVKVKINILSHIKKWKLKLAYWETWKSESDRQGSFFHPALAWSPGQHCPWPPGYLIISQYAIVRFYDIIQFHDTYNSILWYD